MLGLGHLLQHIGLLAITHILYKFNTKIVID